MPHNRCLIKKRVNGGLANAKWGKLGGQNRAIETWGIKIEELWNLGD
jgi:hypothetical protein